MKQWIALLFVMTGCAAAPLMQESYYNHVSPGANVADIEAIYGAPYEVRELPNGMQEYCYVQRVELGKSAVDQLEFVFTVSQGRVVGKHCKRNSTSNFQFFN
jgi:hypothetical protein